MSRSTISTFQLFEKFPNEASAYAYVEKRLWPSGPVCPRCKAVERISKREKGRTGLYCCNACQREFTVKIGTIFEDSKVPLHKWIYAMYIVVTARKGVSSLQLAKEIGITQKSAWFVLSRLREACGNERRRMTKRCGRIGGVDSIAIPHSVSGSGQSALRGVHNLDVRQLEPGTKRG